MNRTLATLALASLTIVAFASTKTFNVVSDKLEYRNLATVESTTEFETFTGKTTKVTGSFTFDPAAKKGAGKLTVDLGSINTGIPTRDEHMRSPGWLDTEKHSKATFQTTRVTNTTGDNYRVTGQFTLRGVTRTITTSAKLRYRAESADTKKAGFTGDVAHLYTKFNVKLSDYGVKIPDIAKGKVNPTVTVSISAYGTAQ